MLEVFDSQGRRYTEDEFYKLRQLIEEPVMRVIHDLQHFVLGENETLILRCTRPMSAEQLHHMRAVIEHALPGRPVLVLPPEVEVCAGEIEVFGVDHGKGDDGPTQEDIDAARKEITDAYDAGRTVWGREGNEWFYIHRAANPHTFDWDQYAYSLTKPKPTT